jgi:hypothetical protein
LFFESSPLSLVLPLLREQRLPLDVALGGAERHLDALTLFFRVDDLLL